MLSRIRKAVFFGAHSDDEMVCAGTLHRLSKLGCEVHVVTFGPAAIENDREGGQASSDVVLCEWGKALDSLRVGTHRLYLEMLPSASLPNRAQEICQVVYSYCEGHKPDLAMILSPHDENTAHAVVGVECERVMRGRVPHVWRCMFPWNYQGDHPNLYVSLSIADLDAKRRVIDCYQSQKFRYDYGTMLMAYAQADGLSIKVSAAEKFQLIRGIL